MLRHTTCSFLFLHLLVISSKVVLNLGRRLPALSWGESSGFYYNLTQNSSRPWFSRKRLCKISLGSKILKVVFFAFECVESRPLLLSWCFSFLGSIVPRQLLWCLSAELDVLTYYLVSFSCTLRSLFGEFLSLTVIILNFKTPFALLVWHVIILQQKKLLFIFFCSLLLLSAFSLGDFCMPIVCGPQFKYLHLGFGDLCICLFDTLLSICPFWALSWMPWYFCFFVFFAGSFSKSSLLWLNTLCLAAASYPSPGSGRIIVWGGMEVWVNG